MVEVDGGIPKQALFFRDRLGGQCDRPQTNDISSISVYSFDAFIMASRRSWQVAVRAPPLILTTAYDISMWIAAPHCEHVPSQTAARPSCRAMGILSVRSCPRFRRASSTSALTDSMVVLGFFFGIDLGRLLIRSASLQERAHRNTQ